MFCAVSSSELKGVPDCGIKSLGLPYLVNPPLTITYAVLNATLRYALVWSPQRYFEVRCVHLFNLAVVIMGYFPGQMF